MGEHNIACEEMQFPNALQKQKRRHTKVQREDCSYLPWQLFAGALAILTLVLIASIVVVIVLIINQSSNQGHQSPPSLPNTTSQRGCYNGTCSKNWIWSRGSCYYISKERKPWEDSQAACQKKNSSLLKIDSKEELQNFLKYLKSYYWIGLSRNGTEGSWLWEDGSALSQDQLRVIDPFHTGNCAYFGMGHHAFYEYCVVSNTYICEQMAI
ncbi:natural killer cells antigen CD94-like [Tachyglossus aculeatus]|uniref:natural killer cells antigen CD94-like n=1 Tax=Tachyglossus aculeatus TaxID=9261 RepID=UPI0018F5530D|nr:natural killer cells antigen CD94-like [Tachyglossus aculeatus]